MQDVPVAVAVISQAQLQNNLATDLTKIGELAPQVMIGRQTVGTGAIIGIRGISSTSSDPGLDQSVAVAIDNVVLSRGRIVTAAMFDLAQVEIMEGPQVLFFGKNSPAGVITLRSAGPTEVLEGYVRAGYEFTADERYLEAAISGPLSDTLGARLAFRASSMEGWMRNVAEPVVYPLNPAVTVPGATGGRRQPEGEDYTGRLTVAWQPSDDLDVTLKVLLSHQKLNSSTGYAESFCTNGQTVPTLFGTIPFPTGDCAKNRVKSEGGLPADFAANYPFSSNGAPSFKTDAVLGSLNVDKSFGDVTVTSTTGYYKQDFVDARNADFTPFTTIWSVQEEDYKLFTQELRFDTGFEGALNLMGGVYFEDSSRFFGNYPDVFHGGLNPTANNFTTVETVAHADNQSFSVFGQVRYRITPAIELAGGARYSHDKKKQDIVNRAVGISSFPFRPEGSVLRARLSDDNISPEVTLSWKPSRDHLVYGAYKTGYKAGAISTAALLFTSATPENVQIGAEKVEGFEAGYKGELFDRRLRFDVTAYTYKYKDLQLGTFDPETISFLIQNAAAARTRGMQASLNWFATDDLSFRGNLGYNRARYLNYSDSQCFPGQTAAQGCIAGRQDLTGKPLTRAPKLTFNLGASYTAHLGGDWKVNLAGDASYSSKYQSAADNAPGGVQPSFWRLNAALHLSPEDERFRLSIIGRNLTNSYYLISTSGRPAGTTNEFIGVFSRPREVALQGEVRF
ncbi:TonB-dependent receptor [Novosphingobium endophyticum]|uniref:TonB-dependent receptor n=1 Tax=Novosphingobium endophyticum TaxID=1955250 RepID=UPI0016660421|nr:TonB-dependent receptor [Novosphingobium endophyticum]